MTQYYLADAATKKRFGPLSQDQIMNFITTNQLNIKNVFIYMQDLGRWIPFLETGMYKAKKSSPKVEDRRLHQRLDIRLDVIFTHQNKAFKTYTKDVSEGGICLEQMLPEYFLNQTVDVFLSLPEKNIKLKFQAIAVVNLNTTSNTQGSAILSNRIEFKSKNDFSRVQLAYLIEQLKKKKSKSAD
jgi:hypothetical protein